MRSGVDRPAPNSRGKFALVVIISALPILFLMPTTGPTMNDVPLSHMLLYTVCALGGAALMARGSNMGMLLIGLSTLFLQTRGNRIQPGHDRLTTSQILSASLVIIVIIGIAIVVGISSSVYSDSTKEVVRITSAFAMLCTTAYVWRRWWKPKD